MKLYYPCGSCGKKKFFVRKRQYVIKEVKLPVTSQSLLCRSCYKGIKKITENSNQN